MANGLIDPALKSQMLRSGLAQGLMSLGGGLMGYGAGGGTQALNQGFQGMAGAFDPNRLYQAQMLQNQLQDQKSERERWQAWDEYISQATNPKLPTEPMLGGSMIDLPGGAAVPGQAQTAMLDPATSTGMMAPAPQADFLGGLPPELLQALGPEAGAQLIASRQPAAPKPTSAMRNAEALGLQPGSPGYDEYIRAVTEPRGTQVNIRNEGQIPPGYRAIRGPEGMVQSLEAIPGSPAAMEQQAAEEAKTAQAAQKQRTTDIVTQDIDTILGQVDEGFPVTGVFSAAASIPGTKAHDVARTLDTIKANIGFDKLQAMRAASPTGGALGQVSERENVLLQSTFGSLAQSQSEDQFKRNLQRLRNVYLDTIHGAGNRPSASAPAGQGVSMPLPQGVSEEDLEYTMQKHGLTREEVLQRLQ